MVAGWLSGDGAARGRVPQRYYLCGVFSVQGVTLKTRLRETLLGGLSETLLGGLPINM